MQFGMTIPLQRFLRRAQPPYGEPDDLAFCWETHRVVLDGQDVLLLVNASSRFLAAACMQPADWCMWEDVAAASIRAALLASGFSEHAADAYAFFGGTPEVTKTHGRRPVAFLNVLVDQLMVAPVCVDAACMVQLDLCRFANEHLAGKAAGFEGVGFAAERFAQDVRRLGLGA